MFKSLILRNFQTHRRLKISFNRHITTIVGPSDAGKSTIIRALRWVCLNEASGRFQRHGSNNTKVELRVGNHAITRKRKGNQNSYRLDNRLFRAVRRAVPGDVARVLSCNATNFQSQYDSPYWLSVSAGEVSRQLNTIVDLGIIDTTLANVATELRQAHSTYDITEQRLEAAKEEAKSLAWVERCEANYQRLKRLEKAYATATQQAASLGDLVRQLQAYQQSRNQAAKRLLLGQRAVRLAKVAKATKVRAAVLHQLIGQLEQAGRLADVKLPDISEWEEASSQRSKLAVLVNQLKVHGREWCQTQKQLLSNSTRLEKSLKGRCPLCGSKMQTA